MASSNNTYLRDAANLFKGKLSTNNEALKEARDEKNGTSMTILIYLICYAATEVFVGDYSRAKAKRFKEDWVASANISAKQAGKWTESVSAALGVRGLRKGIQPLDGLMPMGKEGPEHVKSYLASLEITTFNQFMAATRTAKDHVQELAKKYHGLSTQQRERLLKLVEKLDKDEEGEDDE